MSFIQVNLRNSFEERRERSVDLLSRREKLLDNIHKVEILVRLSFL